MHMNTLEKDECIDILDKISYQIHQIDKDLDVFDICKAFKFR